MAGVSTPADLKASGNALFARGEYDAAVSAYTSALACAGVPADLALQCRANRAQALLKLDEFGRALADAEDVLRRDRTHLKCMYRRGLALEGLGRFGEAHDQYQAVLRLSPGNNDARSALVRLADPISSSPIDLQRIATGYDPSWTIITDELVDRCLARAASSESSPLKDASLRLMLTVRPRIHNEQRMSWLLANLPQMVPLATDVLANGEPADKDLALMRRNIIKAIVDAVASPELLRALASLPASVHGTLRSALLRPLLLDYDDNNKDVVHLLAMLSRSDPDDFSRRALEIADGQPRALAKLLVVAPAATQTFLADATRLSALVDLAEGCDLVAVRCLALAASHPPIRQALADQTHLFDIDDPTGYACLALAKLTQNRGTATRKACMLLRGECTEEQCRVAIEALLYMSVYRETKLAICQDRACLENLLRASADRYALAQIILSLATSADDLRFEKDMESEQERLREVAAKSMPESASNVDYVAAAGSAEEIASTRSALVSAGATKALASMIDAPHSSIALHAAVAKAFLRLAADAGARGRLVADGALRALIAIHDAVRHAPDSSDDDSKGAERLSASARYDSELCTARLCISTNPTLLPDHVQAALPGLLLSLLESSRHEMHEYEALLALTNVSSADEDARERIMCRNGWSKISSSLSSGNELVQLGALEALANLVSCASARKRLASAGGRTDVELFLLFAKAAGEDTRMLCAALAALAMMSDDADIARTIVQLGGIDIVERIVKTTTDADVVIRAQAILDGCRPLS